MPYSQLVLTLFISYTDFMVYEVKKDGTVIHLTDFEEPKPKVQSTLLSRSLSYLPNPVSQAPQKPKETAPEAKKPTDQAQSSSDTPKAPETVVQQIPEEDRQVLAELFGLTVAGELLDLDQAVQLNTHDKKSPPLKLGKFDRSQRGRLHQVCLLVIDRSGLVLTRYLTGDSAHFCWPD